MIFQSENTTYRNIARGLIFLKDSILLVQALQEGHYFLPGGGVELGESVEIALRREIQEELGWDIKVSQFVGCLEHSWQGRKKNLEMNFYFLADVVSGNISEPKSKEEHLKFEWVDLNQLRSKKILPEEVIPLLIQTAKGAEIQPFWLSTLKNNI